MPAENEYQIKYEGAYKFIKGRLLVLRPKKRDYKEIHLLMGIARSMMADDLFQKLFSMEREILDSEKAKKVRAVKNMGYDVVNA
jgi:hypothetical protein